MADERVAVLDAYNAASPRMGDLRWFLRRVLINDLATGVSSWNLTLDALGIRPIVPNDHPHDQGDWERCVRTYDAAPPDLQERMAPPMRAWATQLGIEWGDPLASPEVQLKAARAHQDILAGRNLRALELHTRKQFTIRVRADEDFVAPPDYCAGCGKTFPCPTRRTLTGADEVTP